jgi:hypothetical protein
MIKIMIEGGDQKGLMDTMLEQLKKKETHRQRRKSEIITSLDGTTIIDVLQPS